MGVKIFELVAGVELVGMILFCFGVAVIEVRSVVGVFFALFFFIPPVAESHCPSSF